VSPRSGLDAVVKRKIRSLWEIRSPIIQLVAQRYTTELSRLPSLFRGKLKFDATATQRNWVNESQIIV